MKLALKSLTAGAVFTAVCSGSAEALDVIVSYEVADANHILNGATITTTTTETGDWVTYYSEIDFFLIGESSGATAEISGATGAGSVWNGIYAFDPTVSSGTTETGLGYIFSDNTILAPVGHRDDYSNSGQAFFSDNSGNTFGFILTDIAVGSVVPTVGSSVVEENFGTISNSVLFESLSGSNPEFLTPTDGIATLTIIPEPSSLALLGLGGLLLARRRR